MRQGTPVQEIDVSALGAAERSANPALPFRAYLSCGNGRFEPTRATESPWDRKAQHRGPPTALLAHAIDQTVEGAMRIGRTSVDFLGPIPRREVVVEISPIRPGRRVRLTEARLTVDGRVAVVARAWHIATDGRPPASREEQTAPPVPSRPTPLHFYPGLDDDWGYGRSIEWRFTRGGFDSFGAANVWTRVRLPFDSRRGTNWPGPIADRSRLGEWAFVVIADGTMVLDSATVTTTVLRPPTGEWVHMACRTHLTAGGVGLAHADVFDTAGFVGEVTQPLLIQRRESGAG